MVLNFLRQHLRVLGTSVLMAMIIAFYALSFRVVEFPQSNQFDILKMQSNEDLLELNALELWGITGPLTLFTYNELDRLGGVIENIQYHNDVRKYRRQKMINYLLQNYKINESDARILVRSADANARKYNIDLELLMAIIFVESTYQTNVESNKGAIGLMQVVPRWHLDKISQYGDVDVLYDIRANISIGTEILMEYLDREGDLRTALHRYNGSKNDKTLKYSNRVFKKYHELKDRNYIENALLEYNFDILSPSI